MRGESARRWRGILRSRIRPRVLVGHCYRWCSPRRSVKLLFELHWISFPEVRLTKFLATLWKQETSAKPNKHNVFLLPWSGSTNYQSKLGVGSAFYIYLGIQLEFFYNQPSGIVCRDHFFHNKCHGFYNHFHRTLVDVQRYLIAGVDLIFGGTEPYSTILSIEQRNNIYIPRRSTVLGRMRNRSCRSVSLLFNSFRD
jgi:hypothetical protein